MRRETIRAALVQMVQNRWSQVSVPLLPPRKGGRRVLHVRVCAKKWESHRRGKRESVPRVAMGEGVGEIAMGATAGVAMGGSNIDGQ